MNSVQIAILSLALALNSFIAYLTAGVVMKDENVARKLRYSLVMLFTQAILAASGLWVGVRIGLLASNSNYYIATGMLVFMGLKILLDSIRIKPEDRTFDLSEMRTIIMLSLAEGIPPLIVCIAIGLTLESAVVPLFIVVLFQLLALISGLVLGTVYGSASLKLRTGPIGGLIMLAAAIKLIIDLIGF